MSAPATPHILSPIIYIWEKIVQLSTIVKFRKRPGSNQ